MNRSAPLTIQEIRTRAEFEALRPEWNAVVDASALSSPFLLHEWFACCLAHSPGRELRLVTAREGERLVGIAPFWWTAPVVRGLTLRALSFITCPETAVADLIVHPDWRDSAIESIFRHLVTASRSPWDAMTLAQWPAESPNLATVASIAQRHGWRGYRSTASLAPFITISGTWEEFLEGKSYLFRKSRRGILNRMSRVEGVDVERVTDARGDAILNDLVRISERGQKHRMGVSLAASPDSRRFFQALTEAAGGGGWLDLWILRIQGVPVAFEYDLRYKGVVYALRAEYDEAYTKLSPGAYLEYRLLQACFAERRREYSSGPGLDDYKLRWTDAFRENAVLTLCGPTWRGRWLWWSEGRLWPLLRHLKAQLSTRRAGTDPTGASSFAGRKTGRVP